MWRLSGVVLLAACASPMPMDAPDGTVVARLSEITGSVASSPLGGLHGKTCQMVIIHPENVPCIDMTQGDCTINTCLEANK